MSLQSEDIQPTRLLQPPRWFWLMAAAFVVVGIAGFVVGFAGSAKLDTWLWLLVWFLVFSGFAQGVLVWAATFRVAQARWTPVINRLGHSAITFLPISYLALIILLIGVRAYIPWVTHPIPAKAAWLNVPFLMTRDLVSVAILGILEFFLVRWSLQVDARNQRGEKPTETDQYRLTAIGVAILMTYSLVYSIIAYDLIISLSPEWFSTMFPVYYWITNSYAGLAVLVIMAWLLRGPLGVVRYVESRQFTDLGNLMLGFSLFSMGLFFAQYLTIWYGNIPVETRFLILRYYKGYQWPWLGWTAFFLAYAIPFVLLQSRTIKHRAPWLSAVSVLVIIGVILERYVMVVPSLHPAHIGMSVIPALGGFAFLGFFLMAIALFLIRYPAISTAEEALREIEPKLEAIT